MEAHAFPMQATARPRPTHQARAESVAPTGSLAATVFYLAAALASLAVVVGSAVAAAL